ncbi:MAG: hypothetical protein C4527_00465 [Candidatus Omnitrophota bacterium]|nr:MAG: hypothetical protein C4527_00465 [Candidatus Omnitrophota bacterium]
MATTERPRNTKSEIELILQFIGYKTLMVLGILGSIYFFSGYRNYMQGRPFFQSFTPYYALHLHDGARILNDIGRTIGAWISSQNDKVKESIAAQFERIGVYFVEQVKPFLEAHPIAGFSIFVMAGFGITIAGFLLLLVLVKKIIGWLSSGYAGGLSKNIAQEGKEDIWSFDPRRKPSEDQLKKVSKNLERLVQRAPAMGGSVPKNADVMIRELAQMNKHSEYNYRWAVYVMGPIKGTNFDNSHEIPLALDQIKKIFHSMGQASIYETLPLDLVLLRTKKGTKSWEVDTTTGAVNLGKSYPVKVLERVMTQNRQYFIWDGRAKKSVTGYGTRTPAASMME